MCKIIQQHAIIAKDPVQAHAELLKLPGIARFSKNLKTEDEKEHLERHLRKYVNIYLCDCPFEVATTNRYTITTQEACIKTRKPIRRGEAIKYLSGIQVEMTEKEEKELSSRTDFSIVLSSRRKRPSLFLGPARFANHDCDSNAKLTTTGPHGIHIVARKDIEAGDEITVTYGDDYFGIDNCECLCATCEHLTRNGWDPRGPLLHEDSSDDENNEDEEDEQSKPNTTGNVELQSRSPSTLGKRKRIDDEITLGSHEDSSERRGRGRPRKYPSSAAENVLSDSRRRQAISGGAPQSNHRRRTSDEESLRELAQARKNGRVGGVPRAEGSTTAARSQTTPDHHEGSPSRSSSPSSLLEKIFNLLSSIGERKLREEEELKAKSPTPPPSPPSPPPVPPPRELPPIPGGFPKITDEQCATLGELFHNMQKALPEKYGGMMKPWHGPAIPGSQFFRPPSSEWQASQGRTASPEKSKVESHQVDLQANKKERSMSSLRNVVNAEDEVEHIYGIPPPPAPLHQAQCREGSAENEQSEHPAAESAGSSSPASHHDNFSSASQSSSMTSLDSDSFAAGNIAQSICQMLTVDDEEEETCEAQEEDQAEDVMDVDMPTTTKTDQRAGRETRKSIRQAATTTSTPPVPSIETIYADLSDPNDEDDEKRGVPRIPGDYTLCRSLLSTPYHRWIECRNCDEHFLQSEAYLTRIACPRCERHSKLYGYYWPKTDKEGKFDTEERVLDHRTIHRFIDPEDERNERKGRKTLADVVREREGSGRLGSEEVEVEGVLQKRLRSSPRREESRRKIRECL